MNSEKNPTKMNVWRLILFILTSLVIPITYLIVKYHLFQATTKLKVGLWGIVVIAIMLSAVTVMIRYYLLGLKTKYNLFKQILEGVIKLILPLVLFLAIIVWLGDNIDLIKEALYVIIPCETVAIVLNPFPKWCFDNNIEGIGEIFDKITKRGGE